MRPSVPAGVEHDPSARSTYHPCGRLPRRPTQIDGKVSCIILILSDLPNTYLPSLFSISAALILRDEGGDGRGGTRNVTRSVRESERDTHNADVAGGDDPLWQGREPRGAPHAVAARVPCVGAAHNLLGQIQWFWGANSVNSKFHRQNSCFLCTLSFSRRELPDRLSIVYRKSLPMVAPLHKNLGVFVYLC